MKLNYKYTILYTLLCLFLFWLIINVYNKKCLIEGLTNIPYPKDAVINYNDINSPLYSHNVNLPINDPVSCKNFCGPQSQCAITREQCTSDIDCYGCRPNPKDISNKYITKEVLPYDATGKLGQNQALQYSPLTTGYNKDFSEIYPGSKEVQIIKPYLGIDLWTNSFNKGLELYNKKRESAEKYSQGVSNAIPLVSEPNFGKPNVNLDFSPNYPLSYSATGQFYETTPPASNSSIN